jgi:hypothetical protein
MEISRKDDLFGEVLEDVFGVEVLADIFGDDTLIFPKWEDIRFPEQMPEYQSNLSYENPFNYEKIYPVGWLENMLLGGEQK